MTEEKNLADQIIEGWNKKEKDFSDEQGNCNGCSECCTVFVPVTKTELKILKRKMNKKMINNFIKNANEGNISVKCPFVTEKGCSIYNIKPFVCKAYHCKPSLKRELTSDDVDVNNPPTYMLYHAFDDKDVIELFDTILEVGSEGKFVGGC